MSLPGLDVLVSLIEAEVGRALSATDLNAGSGEDRSVLESLPSALRGLVPSERPVPTSHPALNRWLDPAVESAPEQQRPLAAAVRALAPHLTWKSAYTNAPSSPTMRRFWPNYTFAPVATPEGGVGGVGPLLSAEMSLYLVVQGARGPLGWVILNPVRCWRRRTDRSSRCSWIPQVGRRRCEITRSQAEPSGGRELDDRHHDNPDLEHVEAGQLER